MIDDGIRSRVSTLADGARVRTTVAAEVREEEFQQTNGAAFVEMIVIARASKS